MTELLNSPGQLSLKICKAKIDRTTKTQITVGDLNMQLSVIDYSVKIPNQKYRRERFAQHDLNLTGYVTYFLDSKSLTLTPAIT